MRMLAADAANRSEEHTSELQSLRHLVCRLLLEKTALIGNCGSLLAALSRSPNLRTPERSRATRVGDPPQCRSEGGRRSQNLLRYSFFYREGRTGISTPFPRPAFLKP